MTLIVVGDAGLDVIARHATPLAYAGDTPAEVWTGVGGCGANTAAWLAASEVDTVLVGRVGDDVAGHRAHAGLSARGVRCELTFDPNTPTGCVVVLVDADGQRSMLSDRGANAALQACDLPAPLFDEACHLHLSGYVLLDERSRDAGVDILAAARHAGLTTSVDPQAASLLTETFPRDVAGVDLLLPNTDELRALTGSADPRSAAGLLDVAGAVAVTAGPDGASWIDRTGVWAVAAETVRCVDSTGAGDAFNAGLLAAWLRGLPPTEALRRAVRTAAAAVTRVGAQPPDDSAS
ncbi:MAG: sugar kinase [Kutzneria sp.]|nr:sugar kinase [Kutzneria sp.]MBV9846657.1 sugar kinase [Kutzneria sp.]